MVVKWIILSLCAVLATSLDPQYLIDTEKCRLPNFPAFSEDTNRTHQVLPYPTLPERYDITYTTVKDNVAYLHLNTTALDEISKAQDALDISCCYSNVTRNDNELNPDVGVIYYHCDPLTTTVQLYQTPVYAQCVSNHLLIYANVHDPITVPERLRQRLQNWNTSSPKPLSVIFIVIDSVSRLNLERTMPKTKMFLLDNGFLEFVGYNKIDDNTFPNFNALLTGLNWNMSDEICRPTQVGGLDNCPMIWYDYAKHGYVTAYAEDWAQISTYNYMKKGFKLPPTDYYYKPYFDVCTNIKSEYIDNMPFYCGPQSQGERVLDIAKDFVTTFKDQPKFGIFWMNTFSHENISSPSRMDDVVKKFFTDIRKEGVLDENMVILLSDHGMRFGPIRRTIQGWYEERLPVNFISVPKWFKLEHPEMYSNFKRNTRKLTSTYDLFMTLQDVLAISNNGYKVKSSKGCPTCVSLFSQIPKVRSCKEAGVPEVWCTCLGTFERTKEGDDISEEFIMNASKVALRRIWNSSNNASALELLGDNSTITSAITKAPNGNEYMLLVFKTNFERIYQTLFSVDVDALQVKDLLQIYRIA